jgi:endonuclease/exonuclease/phosphatase family metal-dependent hydrolase
MNKVAEVVKSSKAQVLGFNEIYGRGYNEEDKQVERIAEKVGYSNHYFAKATLGVSAYPMGNGLVSKFAISESESTLVPATHPDDFLEGDIKDFEDRSILRAVIDFNGVPVSVYVTHFGLDTLVKQRMVNTILAKLELETNPYVVMGDFNCEPNDEILAPLFNKMQSTAKVMKNTQNTWATYGGFARIDYIFVSSHFIVKKYKRIDVNYSDHYPCYAEVILN